MKLWIARDKDGMLYISEEKPKLFGDYFDTAIGTFYSEIPSVLFPEVTFENSPQEVELKLVNEIVGANSRNVFIVMRQEEHSDYAEKVFVDKEKAEAYCKPLNDNPKEYSRVIEEMEVTL